MLVNDPALIVPYFTFRDSSLPGGSGLGVSICKYNASRISLTLSMVTGNCTIRPLNGATANLGLALPTGPNIFNMKFADYGSLVSQEWVLTSNLTGTLYILECIFRPPSEVQ